MIPVKPAAIGKSRLRGIHPDHAELARAIALDTIEAASGAALVAQVIVVTDDEITRREAMTMPRVRAVRDGGVNGIQRAIQTGLAAVDVRSPRAALLGDLPALRAADLDRALFMAAKAPRTFIADAEGHGSTLVTAAAGATWRSEFGPGSHAKHEALGLRLLSIHQQSSIRRDVDNFDQLTDAARVGLGARTRGLFTLDVQHGDPASVVGQIGST